ncbi:hypothetical protein GCM10011391_35490 [Pullulanibacillus camelliae]|uniref:Transposase n=1 Tax=Pullulanibacillus camelliae TaxID=1707096 RepID=A0A8J2YMG1_9BACL|nr:transposase [Pullulanibacillus camelliae]GGE53535.1 hypothetical protein GCM10011391_35490 [Pullulanibacillus camelliae]
MGKRHDQEYKEYVAKLVVEEGRKQRDVAYELEVSSTTIGRWVKSYREKGQKKTEKYLTPSEVEKLKREHEIALEELKEENEILKKAMHSTCITS